jgi:hypothetical protein
MRRTVGALLAIAALLPVIPAVAAVVKPAGGDYQGVVNNTATSHQHNEGEGYLSVKLVHGARKIVPYGPFAKILFPSDFTCNQLNANVETPRISISKGAFDYSGTAPIGTAAASRHIEVKGHWTDPKHVVGVTKINGAGCHEAAHWKMKTPVPPLSP